MEHLELENSLTIGENYLHRIGQEAKLWSFFNRNSQYLISQAELLNERATEIGQHVLESTLSDGGLLDFESLAKKLSDQDENELVLSFLANLVFKNVNDRINTEKNLDYGKKAKITILKSGVRGRKFFARQEPAQEVLSGAPQIDVDEVIEGTICDFKTRPKVGGVIGLNRKFSTVYINGLVNATTGEARVRLDIISD